MILLRKQSQQVRKYPEIPMYINHFFKYSACAQLIIAPFDNLVISSNLEASRLLGGDASKLEKSTVTELFKTSLPELLRFTRELVEQSRGWSDQLVVTYNNISLRVETHGRFFTIGQQSLLHLTLNPAEELQQQRARSDAIRATNPSPAKDTQTLRLQLLNQWPGNVDQLNKLMATPIALTSGETRHVDEPAVKRNDNSKTTVAELSGGKPATTSTSLQVHTDDKVLTSTELKQRERNNIIRALRHSQGRIFGPEGAAELLDIKPTTLCAQLKRMDIDRKMYKREAQRQARPLSG